jgi:hypothetical protein
MAKDYTSKYRWHFQRTVDRHPRPRYAPPPEARPPKKRPPARPCPAPDQCTKTKITKTGSNGDEERYGKSYIGNFHKGLPHDDFGEVDRAAYEKLLQVLGSGQGFDQIPLAGERKLVNPQAGLATDLEGPDPKKLEILAAPRLDSAEAAAEAAELYWMALLRDLPFTDFAGADDAAAAAKDISKLDQFTGPKDGGKVTPATLFRGCSQGDLTGPYLSQFLLHDIPYGSLTVSQRQRTVVPDLDYLTDFGAWLRAQNGGPAGRDVVDGTPRYIRNMRDLGRYVHVDALYEAYLNACLILLGHDAPVDVGNPYREHRPGEKDRPDERTQVGFGTFGGPHVLSLVTEVATRALKAVWWQKWFVHRRLRPEAYGGLVQVKLEGACGTKKSYPIHEQVLGSEALARTHAKWGTYLLPMAFPEGSPTHPAYGAGHATVAGACVTVLKAFFDDQAKLPETIVPKVPNAEGTELVDYDGPGAGKMTIGGELDKVAANISIGRNMAGVHWRSDYTESIRLGETVALSILSRQREDYHEKDWSFSLCTFDGDRVTVSREGVRDSKGKPVPGLGLRTEPASRPSGSRRRRR